MKFQVDPGPLRPTAQTNARLKLKPQAETSALPPLPPLPPLPAEGPKAVCLTSARHHAKMFLAASSIAAGRGIVAPCATVPRAVAARILG